MLRSCEHGRRSQRLKQWLGVHGPDVLHRRAVCERHGLARRLLAGLLVGLLARLARRLLVGLLVGLLARRGWAIHGAALCC